MRIWMSVAACMFLAVGAAQANEKIEWAKDWNEARRAAESSNQLIMIDFFTDWCGWCKRLDKDTYSDTAVIKLARDFVAFKTDAEKEGEELAKKYEVRGYPTILFVEKTGEVVGRIGGYMPPEPFIEEVTRIRDAHKELPKLEARLKESPDDGEANARYAEIMAMRDKRAEAEAAIARAEKAGHTGDVLARALNAVGDGYQSEGKLEVALGHFRKADAAGKDPEIRAYARASVISCYVMQDKMEEARAAARDLIALDGAPTEWVERAREFLANTE